MSQIHDQAAYGYLMVCGTWLHGHRPCPGAKQQRKGTGIWPYIFHCHHWLHFSEGTHLCHPWRGCSRRYAHIFLPILFSDVLYILVIKLWVRQRWEWGIKQNTEWSQIQFLSLSLSANSFTFPTELARKNSSENYTKRCFSFWLQRVSHGWLTPAFAALGWRCTVTKAPGWPWETASALSPSERSL